MSTPSNNLSSDSNNSTTDYKAKLDEAAFRAKHPGGDQQAERGNQGKGIIDKVAEYVPEPISSKMLGKKSHGEGQQHNSPPPVDQSVPPRRPDHDEHIQEFVRDQHRSTGLTLEE